MTISTSWRESLVFGTSSLGEGMSDFVINSLLTPTDRRGDIVGGNWEDILAC